MPTTIKFILRTNQPKKDGTVAILMRVTIDRKSKFISTGYFVRESQFREGLDSWVIKHPDATLINAALLAKRSAFMETVYREDIGKKHTVSFFELFKKRIAFYESRNQVAMHERLVSKIKVLQQAFDKDIPVNQIDAAWVQKYVTYRMSAGIKTSTIKKDLANFSNVLNSLPDFSGKDYFKAEMVKLKADAISREKLTIEEIKLLESVELEGLNAVARDMFLFSFYCHGMRFLNVAMFDPKSISQGVITYRMNKGKKIREIVVHAKLQTIIEKYRGESVYLFPVIKRKIMSDWDRKGIADSANALINTRLKRVAVIAGIHKNLHFHIARHTFAFLSLERGVTYEVLKDALGHSNYATTQIYLKSLSGKKINDSVNGLYD